MHEVGWPADGLDGRSHPGEPPAARRAMARATGRRGLLFAGFAGLTFSSAGAAPVQGNEFVERVTAAGQLLGLQATTAKQDGWWTGSVFRTGNVFRAAIYRPLSARHSEALPNAAATRLIVVRYGRTLQRTDIADLWRGRFGRDLPQPFLDWLRPVQAGDVERFLFLPDGIRLDGPGRLIQHLADPGFAASLLRSWIGPAAAQPDLRAGRFATML